jgi:hypothetical protein
MVRYQKMKLNGFNIQRDIEDYRSRMLSDKKTKLFSMRERERKRGRRSDEVDGEVILFYNVEKAV